MNTEEVLKYLKENPEELYKVCDELKLRFPYENKEDLMKVYDHYKKVHEYWKKKLQAEGGHENSETEYNIRRILENMEKTYHMFSPTFNEEAEKRWIPKEYTEEAHEIWEFRKDMYRTQSIYKDYELTNIISKDMGYIWSEKKGQDGMYDAFPFSFTRESIVSENDEYIDYVKSNCHYTHKVIRSYALDSCGGFAIIEHRTYTNYDDMTNIRSEAQNSYTSSINIVTLGEDDGYHFLNSAHIYEFYYGSSDRALKLLDMVIKEFTNYTREF